jgi:hypothetical protein
MVCAKCGVYAREARSDGWNDYTVCAYCGRSEFRFVDDDAGHERLRTNSGLAATRPPCTTPPEQGF